MSKKTISEIAVATLPQFQKMVKDIPQSEKNEIIIHFRERAEILESLVEW